MSKQRRVDGGSLSPTPAPTEPSRSSSDAGLGAELLDALAVGNQAAVGQLADDAGSDASLADRAATALRVAPRDGALTERLVDLVHRSALPEHRRAVIALRLTGDQSVADEVAAAMARRMGGDDPAARSALIGAFERAASAEGGRQGDLAARVGREVGAAPESVRGLVQDLTTLLAVLGDDEEEELAPPGDYAAEESGL